MTQIQGMHLRAAVTTILGLGFTGVGFAGGRRILVAAVVGAAVVIVVPLQSDEPVGLGDVEDAQRLAAGREAEKGGVRTCGARRMWTRCTHRAEWIRRSISDVRCVRQEIERKRYRCNGRERERGGQELKLKLSLSLHLVILLAEIGFFG